VVLVVLAGAVQGVVRVLEQELLEQQTQVGVAALVRVVEPPLPLAVQEL
jgi:hypothetical protein